MTSNVEDDWPAAGPRTVILTDALDVGTLSGLSTSGWDIKDIRFHHDGSTDRLFVGINCFGICGDADGDGDPA